MSLPRGVSRGDFLTVIDRVGAVTSDGPLPLPLSGRDGAADSFGWVHADPETQTFTAVDAVVLREDEHEIAIAAVINRASCPSDGELTVRVAGGLCILKPEALLDRTAFAAVLDSSNPVDLHGAADTQRVYERMLGIGDAALEFALQQIVNDPVYYSGYAGGKIANES